MTLDLCYIRLERIPLQPTTPLTFRLLGCHSFHPRNIFHVFTCVGLETTQAMGECLSLISSLGSGAHQLPKSRVLEELTHSLKATARNQPRVAEQLWGRLVDTASRFGFIPPGLNILQHFPDPRSTVCVFTNIPGDSGTGSVLKTVD